MLGERVVAAFWPIWTVVLAAAAPLMFDVQSVLPPRGLWVYAGIVAVLFAAGAVYAYRSFRWPDRSEAVARVDAMLTGRPIATLADTLRIGQGDAASEAVWNAHLRRMEERTRAARTARPDLRISSVDRYGLRYLALLGATVGVLFGSVWSSPATVGGAVPEGSAIATGPAWEGWIEPPAYTGRPSLYLADLPSDSVAVPVGSKVTIRLYGETGALTLSETVSSRLRLVSGDQQAAQQDFTVSRDGVIAIRGEGGAEWAVKSLPDQPPTVTIAVAPDVSADGEMSQGFTATDDYGVTGGEAAFALDLGQIDRRYALAVEPDFETSLLLDLPLPITGDRRGFDEQLVENLSTQPMANLPVTLQMTVTDAAGQTGQSDEVAMVLPGRRFFQPVARAVIEQRRDLMWSAQNAPRVLGMLRTVAHRPEDLFRDEAAYLRLTVALRRFGSQIDEGLTDTARAEMVDAMWDLAVMLEEGSLADARERLRRAQERLAEAMRNGASPEEIQELMDELRDATDDYMRMLSEQSDMSENGTDQPDQGQPDSFEFSMNELDALLDRIQELMEEGRMAEAEELMQQLNDLLENMRITQGDGSDGPRNPGERSMQGLSDTLRDQQELSDDAFRDLQEQFNEGQPSQPGQPDGGQQGQGQSPGQETQNGQQGDQGQGGEAQGGTEQGGNQQDGAQTLADRQNSLRDELDRQRGELPRLDGDAAEALRRSLEQAEGAMDGAEDALRDGDLGRALDRQAEAIDALREGMRNLADALAQNRRSEPGQGNQDGAATGQLEPTRRDPLGRQFGNTGQFGSDQNMLQGPDVYRRAEELLEELRRRSSEQDRPELELEYLKRLLDRF